MKVSSIKRHASRATRPCSKGGGLDQAAALQRIVAALADLPGVAAISLGGSTAAGLADAASDLDVYVFYHQPLAASADRAARLRALADVGSLEVGILTFGLEDHLHV